MALAAVQRCHRDGGWVLLQNVHLTIDWTSKALVELVEALGVGAHPDFRCVAPKKKKGQVV